LKFGQLRCELVDRERLQEEVLSKEFGFHAQVAIVKYYSDLIDGGVKGGPQRLSQEGLATRHT